MFNNNFTVSIEKGSNKVISSSEDKFYGISEGNLIKIGDHNELYSITGKDNDFIIKEFNVLNPKTLIVNGAVSNKLQIGDTLKITYKEYELSSIVDIISDGNNYKIGEDLSIEGGVLSVDITNGNSFPAKLTVTESNINLGIVSLSIKDKGRYISPPPEEAVLVSSLAGNSAKIACKFEVKENRSVIERTIINIVASNDGNTYLTINYSIPTSVKNGKFSTEKHYLTLSNNYNGDSGKNLSYKVFRDITPELKLPLMLRGSMSPELIFNKCMLILDKEISSLKSKINK